MDPLRAVQPQTQPGTPSPHETGNPDEMGTGAAGGPPSLTGYEIVRPLGTGAAGTVWLVREAATGRLLAAKVLWPGPRAEGVDGALATAQREVRISQARPHEHILAVRHALAAEGTAEGAVALLTDYAPGGSLGRLIRARGSLPVGEAVTAVAPIAQALAALHSDGTAHGDVSPGNILFTSDGMPLLGDFGLGRMVGDVPGAAGGTPGFTAPESAGGSARLGAGFGGTRDGALPAPSLRPAVLAAAADVFSLGAVAWFALTGEPPAPTAHRPPLSLLVEDVPSELAAAIEAALREDPRERPSAEEFSRSVLRSARPAPVDLAPAVDASVLPELRTRYREPPPGRRALRRPGTGAGRGSGRTRRAGRRAVPAAGGAGPREGRGGPRALWAAAAALAVGTVAASLWWTGSLGPGGGGSVGGGAEAARGLAQQGGAPRGAAWEALPEGLRRGADSADPVQAVQALSEIRARAVAARDRELLAAVNATGSEAAAADAALLDRLAADGQKLEGFSARVLYATLDPAGSAPTDAAGTGATGQAVGTGTAGGAETAVVRAHVVTSGYTVTDDGGATVGERASGRDQELRIVLQRDGPRWKVARILAA